MGDLSIANATASDLTNRVTDYSVSPVEIDGASMQDETFYTFPNWSKQYGYFHSIGELKSAIMAKATWICGKGYTTDSGTKVILDHISGWGKDTFLEVLWNMEIVKRIGGDSFAEIIRDDDRLLINLKPLDTGKMRVVVDGKGMIKRYELVSAVKGQPNIKFEPKDIFHLCHNRIANQIHGLSDVDTIEKEILADGESFDDIKKLMHRQARPMIMFKLATSDQAKINNFISKMDKAVELGENIYIPFDKDSIDVEVIQADISPNTLAWRDEIRKKFYRIVNMPLVVFGQAAGNESGSKIEYLAHETFFQKDALQLENQILKQLGLTIKLYSPVSLLENLQTDENKDANQGLDLSPEDTASGVLE